MRGRRLDRALLLGAIGFAAMICSAGRAKAAAPPATPPLDLEHCAWKASCALAPRATLLYSYCSDWSLENLQNPSRAFLEEVTAALANVVVGAPLFNVYSSDPNVRMTQLLNESKDLRKMGEEWQRIWFTDPPSPPTPERVHGGIQ